MGECTAKALISMPAPKKAMTQTMGEPGKTRPRPSKRDFFPLRGPYALPPQKSGAYRIASAVTIVQEQCPSWRRSAGAQVTTAATARASASLRSVRTEIPNLRGGNDAPWKTPKASFPPRLEIRQKAPDSHIPTASTTTISLYFQPSRAPPHRIR